MAHSEKVRQNLSTPVFLANLDTRWPGIRLQSCRKQLNFEADGRDCFVFFIACQVAGFKYPVHHSLGLAVFPLWDGCEETLQFIAKMVFQSRQCSDVNFIVRERPFD